MEAKKCTEGGLPTFRVKDEDGYRTTWQRRDRRLVPIRKSYRGRSIRSLPYTVYEEHKAAPNDAATRTTPLTLTEFFHPTEEEQDLRDERAPDAEERRGSIFIITEYAH